MRRPVIAVGSLLITAWMPFICAAEAPAEAPPTLDDSNVVFETPSPDASGAMPIGNGEVGASVWVEPSGDILLYLARSDSYSEACRLLKVGRIRLSFQPPPSTAFGSFRQELKLRQGRFEVELDAISLAVLVEPDRPVVRITARSDRPFFSRVTYEGWRREPRVLNGTLELNNSGWTMQGGPPNIPVVESADVVLPAERSPSALVFYHHNTASVVPVSLRLQSCEQLPGGFDPILHRTFGAWIEGPGLYRTGTETLANDMASTTLDLRIACPTLVSPKIDRWLDLARRQAHDAPEPRKAKAAAEAWWRDFWARSWVFVDQPVVASAGLPIRVGCDATGGHPFAGSFGRVSVYDRALRPAEIARLVARGPLRDVASADGFAVSVLAPRVGQVLPASAGLDLAHGFSLEAWVRPAHTGPGCFFIKASAGEDGAVVFDAPAGCDLRLIAGKGSVAPPDIASTSTATASHVFNSLAALNEQQVIRGSHDLSIARFTWWDHRGTREWVQYDFREAATVGGCEVYWFDDTPSGGACRVPKSWRVLYRDGDGQWQPVCADDNYGTRTDSYNTVAFDPVRTSALRLDVQLETGFSGGILEWRVRDSAVAPILTTGAWHHVAATCSIRGTMTLYHNGRMVAHRPPGRITPISQAYALQRYMNACQGRGEAPIKFNGGMFTVEPRHCNPALTGSPDWRLWGDGYWYQNTRHMYHPMPACGDADFMMPLFAFYGRALPLARDRAKSWYGADGAFFPETINFFGAYPNGDYGWNRSDRRPGDVWCPAWKTAWNQGPELVALMLDCWDFTGDTSFLRDKLLPMAVAVLRYFDTRFRKEDGRIVIDPTQAVETYRAGVLDDMPAVAGLHAITGRLCDLPAALTTPSEHRLFARMLDACPPVPLEEKSVDGVKQNCLSPARTYSVEGWNHESAELYAVWPFRLYGVGKPDLDVARATYRTRRYAVENGWGYDGNVAAQLGLTGEAARILQTRCHNSHPAYRFPATWGPNYDWLPDQTHGGNLMETTHLMLLQNVGRKILLLPAWPPGWNVSFRLHAPGRTVVEAAVRGTRLTRLVVEPTSRRADIEICAPFTNATNR